MTYNEPITLKLYFSQTKTATRLVSLALLDQALWSGGFFIFSALTALQLPAQELASLAVATAIGLVLLGMVRVWAIDSVIAAAGAQALDGLIARASKAYALASACAIGATFGILSIKGAQTDTVGFAAFAGGLVTADYARYRWSATGRLATAVRYSAAYLLMAVIVATASILLGERYISLWGWMLTLLIFSPPLVRSLFVKEQRHSAPIGLFARHMTAEAMYMALGGQAAILILWAQGATEGIVGLRLAYSLAFAAAGLLIQGLAPQVLRLVAQERDSRRGASLAVAWGGSCIILYLCTGIGFVVLSHYLNNSNFDLAKAFILPSGALLASAALMNALQLPLRYRLGPAKTQLLRLAFVCADLAFQFVGLFLAGVDGLRKAMLLAALLRMLASLGIVVILTNANIISHNLHGEIIHSDAD